VIAYHSFGVTGCAIMPIGKVIFIWRTPFITLLQEKCCLLHVQQGLSLFVMTTTHTHTHTHTQEPVRKEQDAFMIGYVSAKMNSKTNKTDVVFASQGQHDGIVDLDVNLLVSRFDESESLPLEFLLNKSKEELLAPCSRNVSKMGIGPCTDVDTFSPKWFGDQGDVIFGYRAWSAVGLPRGNQALALYRKSTKSIERLTWTDDDIHTSDTCPMKYGDSVLFIREFMEGSSRSVAVLNGSSVNVISEAPQPSDWGGCLAPAYVGDEDNILKVIYIGDETKGEFGKKATFSLDLEDKGVPQVKHLFDVPLVNTTIADFALSLQYCTPLLDRSNKPVPNIVLCDTAYKSIAILDANTGSFLMNITVPENRESWDMTQYSYQAFCV